MTYAVFLRAINLGKHNKMPMKELKAWLEDLGFSSIQTHLQTGNIWFESKLKDPEKVAVTLEAMLEGRGYQKVYAMVRTERQLRELLEVNPFSAEVEGYQCISFLRRPSALELPLHPKLEVRLARATELLTYLEKALPGQSPLNLNGHLETKLKVPSTSRFWNVVEEFLDLRQ
jgi:uncharacterized protein (DUF1697 family)